MKAFTNASLAEDEFAEIEIDHLQKLRSAIQSALTMSQDNHKIFDDYNLTRGDLRAHDYWLEDAMAIPHAHSTLNAEDLDLIIPFISNLGRAYSQVMTQSLTTNIDVANIEQAEKLHTMLNFFYAQKARLSPNNANEPTLRNE